MVHIARFCRLRAVAGNARLLSPATFRDERLARMLDAGSHKPLEQILWRTNATVDKINSVAHIDLRRAATAP